MSKKQLPEQVPLDAIRSGPKGPVTLNEREGVFAHFFKCLRCKLEFAVFSWLQEPEGPEDATRSCPECQAANPACLETIVLNASRRFSLDGLEIFQLRSAIRALASASSRGSSSGAEETTH